MNVFSIKSITLTAILLTMASLLPLSSEQTIVLSHPTILGSPNEKTQNLIDVYKIAFSQLGYEIVLQMEPSKRVRISAEIGETDGIFRSEEEGEDSYKNLVKVDVPMDTLHFTAYSRDPDLELSGWASLSGTSYRVYYYGSLARCAEMLALYVDAGRLGTSGKSEQGLRMVMAERCDVFVDIADRADRVIERNEDLRGRIYKSGLMESQETFLYLHWKHSGIISELEIILERMKKEGMF